MLRLHDVLLHVGALCVFVTGVSAFNSDVRKHVVNIVAGDSASELAIIAAPVNDVVRLASDTLRDAQGADAPLVMFAVAAIVLFGLLFRS